MAPITETLTTLAFDPLEHQNYLFFRLIGSGNYHSQRYTAALSFYRHSFFLLASKGETNLDIISQDLHRIAWTLRRLQNFPEALVTYSIILQLYELRNCLTMEYILTMRQCAETHWEHGSSDKAFAFLKHEKSKLTQNAHFTIELHAALLELVADCHVWNKDVAGAEQSLQNAFSIIKTHPEKAQKLENQLLWHRAFMRKTAGNYEGALRDWSLLLDYHRSSSNFKAECELLPRIGFMQRILGDYPASLRSYERSLELAGKINWKDKDSQDSFKAFVVNNIGIVHTTLGSFSKASTAYEASLQFSETVGNSESKAYAFGGLGWLSFEQGEYDLAKKYYEKSIAIFSQLGKAAPPPVLISLAEVEMRLCQADWKDRAFSLVSQAEKVAERTGSEANKVRAKLGWAAITAKEQNIGSALELCDEAHQHAQAIGFFEGKITSQLLGARFCLEALEHPKSPNDSSLAREALKLLKQSKTHAKAAGATVLVLEAMVAESAVNEALGDFNMALKIQQKAFALAKSTGFPNSRYQEEIEKLSMYQKAASIYNTAKSEQRDNAAPMSMIEALDYLQGVFRILKAYSDPHNEAGGPKHQDFSSVSKGT
ncbi:MAG: tetratricopeptide repeat protein [Candidatus Hodarchaeales archaeon]|jgi:tetratricopeptide (TPR) repeat protein